MPNRILRDGIITSERVNALSWEAELFLRRLMSVADDYGRYWGHPALLRAGAYPHQLDRVSEEHIERWLTECSSGKDPLIIVYEVKGTRYCEISKFKQRTRSAESKFPVRAPDDRAMTVTPPSLRAPDDRALTAHNPPDDRALTVNERSMSCQAAGEMTARARGDGDVDGDGDVCANARARATPQQQPTVHALVPNLDQVKKLYESWPQQRRARTFELGLQAILSTRSLIDAANFSQTWEFAISNALQYLQTSDVKQYIRFHGTRGACFQWENFWLRDKWLIEYQPQENSNLDDEISEILENRCRNAPAGAPDEPW